MKNKGNCLTSFQEYNRNRIDKFQDKMESHRGGMKIISTTTKSTKQDKQDLHDTTTKFHKNQ